MDYDGRINTPDTSNESDPCCVKESTFCGTNYIRRAFDVVRRINPNGETREFRLGQEA